MRVRARIAVPVVPFSQTFTANPANQISSAGYSYDGTGNLTADPSGSYAYNGAEQMKSVTKSGTVYSYKYAGTSQDEVLQEHTPSADFNITYGRTNAQGQAVVEQVSAGGATAYVENDPVTGQPLMLRTSSGIQALYIYTGTGSPTALLTDFASVSYAYAFDPYGVPVLTSGGGGSGVGQNPFLFSGGIQDRTTGWVHFGARWYDPATGRWTQQDTLDSPLDPHNANRYAYAGDDPLNNLDANGTDAAGCSQAIVGLTFGGLALAAGLVGLAIPVVGEAEIGLLAGGVAAGGVIFGTPDALISGIGVGNEC